MQMQFNCKKNLIAVVGGGAQAGRLSYASSSRLACSIGEVDEVTARQRRTARAGLRRAA